MFTVEFEPDASVIVSLDESDEYEDVTMVLADDGTVFFSQYEDALDENQMIRISYQQLIDLFASLKSTKGIYKVEDVYGIL
tara:strand:- start:191 stop:433 length:243 start_codon:yes stop_codon:yes gene_type:complete